MGSEKEDACINNAYFKLNYLLLSCYADIQICHRREHLLCKCSYNV